MIDISHCYQNILQPAPFSGRIELCCVSQNKIIKSVFWLLTSGQSTKYEVILQSDKFIVVLIFKNVIHGSCNPLPAAGVNKHKLINPSLHALTKSKHFHGHKTAYADLCLQTFVCDMKVLNNVPHKVILQ